MRGPSVLRRRSGPGLFTEARRETAGYVLGGVVIAAILGGFVWLSVEYIWPSKASWRSVCDDGYWQHQYVPVTNCTNGNCTTTVERRSDFVCTRSHWECVKGRDGSTRCAQPRPGSDF